MAKYILSQNVANAKKFRHNGNQYYPNTITQKQLKDLYKSGCVQVTEIKTTKQNEQVEESKSDD